MNVDIDVFEANFKEIMTSILSFINQYLLMSTAQFEQLLNEMNWFDIERSLMYRFKLKAVSRLSTAYQERRHGLLKMVQEDKEIRELYKPVFALYDAAIASADVRKSPA